MTRIPDLQKWLMWLMVSASVLSGFACAGRSRRSTAEPGATAPDRVQAVSPGRMNRAMLASGDPSRIVVEVDWVAGSEPEEYALRALGRWLRRASGRPADAIEVRKGRVVPRPGTDGEGNAAREALVEAVAVNARPSQHPDAYYVYVLYWDRFERYRGVCWPPGTLDDAIEVPVVTMFVRPIERDSALWLTRRKVEAAVLVHEFGHLAGLVTSGRSVGPGGRAGHCPDPACRMYWGVDRASIRANLVPALCLGRLPLRFCGACEAELAAGRE